MGGGGKIKYVIHLMQKSRNSLEARDIFVAGDCDGYSTCLILFFILDVDLRYDFPQVPMPIYRGESW